MKKYVFLFIFLIFISNIFSQELKNLGDSASYSIGVNLGKQFEQQSLQSLNPDILAKAIKDVLSSGTLLVDFDQTAAIIQSYIDLQKQETYNKNIAISEKFLAENKKRKDVVTLPSGLQYEIMVKGTGETPLSTDKVEVHYHGTLIDGTVFDSSVQRGTPASFPVTGVIKGWIEALQLMPVGSKWKLFIPADLAYGANPRPGGVIEPYMALVFEVELLSIVK